MGPGPPPAAGPGTAAVFDRDGTIVRGDTCLAFLAHLLRRRPHRLAHAASLPLDTIRFGLGRKPNEWLKSRFLRAIGGGCSRPDMAAHVDSFLPGYLRRAVKPMALARIEWHRARGHRLILASASLDFYTEPLARRLRFDLVLSTRAAWREGTMTGELDGANLRGEAKLAAVRAAIGEGADRPEIFAYSDHRSDLPLLRFADRGIAVDPSARFAAVAMAAGLAVERWKRPGPS